MAASAALAGGAVYRPAGLRLWALAFGVVEEGVKGGGESGVEEGGGGEQPGVESGPAWPEKGSKPPGPPALAEREEVGD